ncbi:thiol reductant ABC exporter subunit CydC [Pseudalkalibacillus hwajinpoensis]|uniref:thiol reductant ABC exporter subunit CydC n=1 Tax=Guptibacillus hwajinpoensis TaxID=208199 RepID=UPI00325AA7C7
MKELSFVLKEMISEKRDVFLSICFGFLAGMTAVALFASSGFLISKAALSLPVFALAILTAVIKLFGLARAAGRYFERYYSHRATFTILSNMRVSFYEKLEPHAPRLFQTFRSGELLGRIVGDIDRLQHFFLRVFYPPIIFLLIFLATILFTLYFSLVISFLLIAGVILTGFIVPMWFAYSLRQTDRAVREKRGMFSADVAEFFYGFRDLKVMKRLDTRREELEETSLAYIEAQKREGVVESFHRSMISFVSLFVSWTVITVGAYLVTTGELDGVFLAMLVLISLTAFENASPMALLPAYVQDSTVAARRLSSVVTTDHKEKQVTRQLVDHEAFSITINDLSFSFPGEQRLALEHLSLHISAGEKIAIVGPSGSGKSTLMQLLLKFYEVEGSIKLNNELIDSFSEEDVWGKSNVVLQDNHFFYGTVRDNLLLASEELHDDALRSALHKVQLSYLSIDQNVLERGENLSGGEKQRLAIARAMLKKGRLWLLDEPTSSVDVLTEKVILDHLFEQAAEDTLLLISHRLHNLEQMDQIFVMDKGRAVESGTYEELMKERGYFYKMREIEKSVLL